MRMEETDLGV